MSRSPALGALPLAKMNCEVKWPSDIIPLTNFKSPPDDKQKRRLNDISEV
jgi:hypothetical protein